VVAALKAGGRRPELAPAHTDSIGARIRRAKLEKVPYVLVVGDDDVEHHTVGVNARGSESPERDIALDDFLARLAHDVDTHAIK
jgi:threonyl-tRNA synthetase